MHGACPAHSPHDGAASSGSSTVFVNGRPICRIGDGISCGDTMAKGKGVHREMDEIGEFLKNSPLPEP
ncbi:MAG: PAAR domain-containing protein, partial [Sporomusa sp.]